MHSSGPATFRKRMSFSSTNRRISAAAAGSEIMLASMTTWGLPARFQRLSINSAPPDSTPWNRIAVPSLSITSCRERSRYPGVATAVRGCASGIGPSSAVRSDRHHPRTETPPRAPRRVARDRPPSMRPTRSWPMPWKNKLMCRRFAVPPEVFV